MKTLKQVNALYPVNGFLKSTLTLSNWIGGKFKVSVRDTGPSMFDESCQKVFNCIDDAEKFFNEKLEDKKPYVLEFKG